MLSSSESYTSSSSVSPTSGGSSIFPSISGYERGQFASDILKRSSSVGALLQNIEPEEAVICDRQFCHSDWTLDFFRSTTLIPLTILNSYMYVEEALADRGLREFLLVSMVDDPDYFGSLPRTYHTIEQLTEDPSLATEALMVGLQEEDLFYAVRTRLERNGESEDKVDCVWINSNGIHFIGKPTTAVTKLFKAPSTYESILLTYMIYCKIFQTGNFVKLNKEMEPVGIIYKV